MAVLVVALLPVVSSVVDVVTLSSQVVCVVVVFVVVVVVFSSSLVPVSLVNAVVTVAFVVGGGEEVEVGEEEVSFVPVVLFELNSTTKFPLSPFGILFASTSTITTCPSSAAAVDKQYSPGVSLGPTNPCLNIDQKHEASMPSSSRIDSGG